MVLLISRASATNSSIDAATATTPRAVAGVPEMYAEPPAAWLPSLPAEATNTVPRSTTALRSPRLE